MLVNQKRCTRTLPVSSSSRREAERLYTNPHDEEIECRIFIGHRCSRRGWIWFVLRPGRHFDPSLWGNPATSASAVLGATWFKRAAPRKFPSGPYPSGAQSARQPISIRCCQAQTMRLAVVAAKSTALVFAFQHALTAFE